MRGGQVRWFSSQLTAGFQEGPWLFREGVYGAGMHMRARTHMHTLSHTHMYQTARSYESHTTFCSGEMWALKSFPETREHEAVRLQTGSLCTLHNQH